MSTSKNNTVDALATLANSGDNQTKFGALVCSIESPVIRDEFAKVINARASQDSVCALIECIAELAPEKLGSALKAFSLTNASALRQALEKTFKMPQSGKASVTGGSAGF